MIPTLFFFLQTLMSHDIFYKGSSILNSTVGITQKPLLWLAQRDMSSQLCVLDEKCGKTQQGKMQKFHSYSVTASLRMEPAN